MDLVKPRIRAENREWGWMDLVKPRKRAENREWSWMGEWKGWEDDD